MPKPVKLPPGYIAIDEDADVFACDSLYLNIYRKVYGKADLALNEALTVGSAALRRAPKLDLHEDPRLERIISYAQTLKKRYSGNRRLSVREREKEITDLLMDKIYDEFGAFSDKTMSGDKPKAEKDAEGILSRATPQLKDIPKGRCVCRHFAPIVSLALHNAGIENWLVDLSMAASNMPGLHACVITKAGNAVVEGNEAGRKVGDWKASAYRPILNGVTAEDIVYRGKSAVTRHSHDHGNEDGRFFAAGTYYGGHPGDGKLNAKQLFKSTTEALKQSTYKAIEAAFWEYEKDEKKVIALAKSKDSLSSRDLTHLTSLAYKYRQNINFKAVLHSDASRTDLEDAVRARFLQQLSDLEKDKKNVAAMLQANAGLLKKRGIKDPSDPSVQLVYASDPKVLEVLMLDCPQYAGKGMTSRFGLPSEIIRDALLDLPASCIQVKEVQGKAAVEKTVTLALPDASRYPAFYSDTMCQKHPYLDYLGRALAANGLIATEAQANAKSWTLSYDQLALYLKEDRIRQKLEQGKEVRQATGKTILPPDFGALERSKRTWHQWDDMMGFHKAEIKRFAMCTDRNHSGCYEMEVEIINSNVREDKRSIVTKRIVWENQEGKDGKAWVVIRAAHDKGKPDHVPPGLKAGMFEHAAITHNPSFDEVHGFLRKLAKSDLSFVGLSVPRVGAAPHQPVQKAILRQPPHDLGKDR